MSDDFSFNLPYLLVEVPSRKIEYVSEEIITLLPSCEEWDYIHELPRELKDCIEDFIKSTLRTTISNLQFKNGRGEDINGYFYSKKLIMDDKLFVINYFLESDEKDKKGLFSEMFLILKSLAHDMKSPVNNSFALIELLGDHLPDEESKTYLTYFHKNMTRLNTLLGDMIGLSIHRSTRLSMENINLNKMVGKIFGEQSFYEGVEKIKFINNVNPKTIIQCDENRLHIILSNLVNNAVKYHNLLQESPTIEVNAIQEDQFIEFEVKDNGKGIPVEYHEKIFEILYRIDNDKNGSGLGLHLVKDAVKKLGGLITLKSDTNKGSSFFVKIPVY